VLVASKGGMSHHYQARTTRNNPVMILSDAKPLSIA
jgi:hypothetical protein